jgi:lysozyme
VSTVCGYDVSHYDGCSSFHDAYNAGFILAICKATQGVRYTDPKYVEYMLRLNTIDGQLTGAYHFGDDSGPLMQASQFLSVVGDAKLLALDWETNIVNGVDHTMSLAQAEQFVSRIHAIRGKWPMLYTGNLAKETHIPATSPLLNCELWLAQYSSQPVLPNGWKSFRLWQSSGDGVGPLPHDVPGIGKSVDVNRFPGSLDDCRRWYSTL